MKGDKESRRQGVKEKASPLTPLQRKGGMGGERVKAIVLNSLTPWLLDYLSS